MFGRRGLRSLERKPQAARGPALPGVSDTGCCSVIMWFQKEVPPLRAAEEKQVHRGPSLPSLWGEMAPTVTNGLGREAPENSERGEMTQKQVRGT